MEHSSDTEQIPQRDTTAEEQRVEEASVENQTEEQATEEPANDETEKTTADAEEYEDDLNEIEEEEDDDEAIFNMNRHRKGEPERQQQSQASESRTIDESGDFERNEKRAILEQKLNDALKTGRSFGNRRRKRKTDADDIDLEKMQDSHIQELKKEMENAAYEDANNVEQRKGLATNKLKLLPRVSEVLMRKNLADSVLDNNLLESVRMWLEPLPDGSLPAYEIQKVLLNSLIELPIKTIHLRESGIGKVILFYQKSKRVEPTLKRIADKLVGNWTRPILNLSDNYQDKFVEQAEFDVSKLLAMKRNKKKQTEQPVEKTFYEEVAERRKRAAAPAARTTAYRVAPKVNLAGRASESAGSRLQAAGIGSGLAKDDQYKRLSRKMLNNGKKVSAKKTGVSIEGRDLHI